MSNFVHGNILAFVLIATVHCYLLCFVCTFHIDCIDFEMSLSGAVDTRTPGNDTITYSFFEEVTVSYWPSYTCDLLNETVVWRHIRSSAHVDTFPMFLTDEVVVRR